MRFRGAAVSVFVVSWISGQSFQGVPCVGKEPEPIRCVKPVEQRSTKEFKDEKEANAYALALTDTKAPGVKIERK